MEQKTIRIGSRGSDLALWQAHYVTDLLRAEGYEVEIIIIKTSGDRIQHLSFDKMEGKGFFTKEIEEALSKDQIDLAVHSHKDLETSNPPGLIIAAVPSRADVRDVLLIRRDAHRPEQSFQLDATAIVGTSSARRKALLKYYLPTVELKDLRGNVPTRVNKLRAGEYNAILLAKAGLDRLNLDLSDLVAIPLDPTKFVPAPAQGALGLQIRDNDHYLRAAMKKLHDPVIGERVEAERHILKQIQGGCQVPMGAYCVQNGQAYELHAAYARTWDSEVRFFREIGGNPTELAQIITAQILAQKNA